VGNNLPLMLFATEMASSACATLISNLGSVVLDFVARHKAGGTHMNYFIYKQLPILPPSQYSQSDISFILPRVLELTYTACDLEAWAADIWNNLDGAGRLLLLEAHHAATWRLESERLLKEEGIHRESIVYSGAGSDELEKMEFSPTILPPFPFHPERRAEIRAELDARYARLYGLTRDELRYILDPADVMGEDYPSETFRVLKNREVAEFGEYRTGRLVLEAWDREDQV